LKANATESSDNISTNTLTLTRDAGGPDSFSLDSPGEFSNNEDTTVEVSVSDQYSGVENISIVVEMRTTMKKDQQSVILMNVIWI